MELIIYIFSTFLEKPEKTIYLFKWKKSANAARASFPTLKDEITPRARPGRKVEKMKVSELMKILNGADKDSDVCFFHNSERVTLDKVEVRHYEIDGSSYVGIGTKWRCNNGKVE